MGSQLGLARIDFTRIDLARTGLARRSLGAAIPLALTLAFMLVSAQPLAAQSVADFYRGMNSANSRP